MGWIWSGHLACGAPDRQIIVSTRVVPTRTGFNFGQSTLGFKVIFAKMNYLLRMHGLTMDDLREILADPFTSHPLRQALINKSAQAVVEFDGQLRAIDGHHGAYMAHVLQIPTIQLKIVEDYSLREIDSEQYWQEMMARERVHLYDHLHNKIDPHHLPQQYEDFKNDPFRSLAWFLRKAHLFSKNRNIAFQEFYWARFLRAKFTEWNLPIDFDTDLEFEQAIYDAIEIILSIGKRSQLKSLPGYHPVKTRKIRAQCAAVIQNYLPER